MAILLKEKLCKKCQGQSRKKERALCELCSKDSRYLQKNKPLPDTILSLKFSLLVSKGITCGF